MMLWFWLTANFLISRIIHIEATNEVCRGEYSVSGMFLKGHTFKTITVDSPTRCQMLCSQDVRCQSYNFNIGKDICELNNRTKEARPQDLQDDPWKFYMKGGFSRGVWQKINYDPVCFGARDDTYGSLNLTKTGFVKAMKLIHRNGSIRCNRKTKTTYWSCSNARYGNNSFMTIITNAKRQALLPSENDLKTVAGYKNHFYVLNGIRQGSSELVLGNLSKPLRLSKDQELQIWYGQDWVNSGEEDNSGKTCADIFAWYM
ncbi:uncharacterized protein [Acropora muricata]|uniref:uncharacterized protein isoform X2 n=1 Tax=Acropora muricata TaxID=159855 RepID=UPI0034E49732